MIEIDKRKLSFPIRHLFVNGVYGVIVVEPMITLSAYEPIKMEPHR